jgi:outer membrane protein OmpA-like peptidoglycan-associated protein
VELLKMEVDKSVALRNVFFDFGQHIPTAASFKELNVLYQLMIDQPNIKVEISGHTDNRGSLRANQIMSERRAKAIVDFLIRNGIEPARLTFVGYGYERPVAPNNTVEGRSQNRRTEFKIISQ